MGNKLFVGGLAWATTDGDLRKAFEEFGTVKDAKVITDRDTGQSRGFGFVTFENTEDAKSALDQMNGSVLQGRTVRVNEAEDKGRSGGGGFRPREGGGGFNRDNGWGGRPAPQVESRGGWGDRGGRGGGGGGRDRRGGGGGGSRRWDD